MTIGKWTNDKEGFTVRFYDSEITKKDKTKIKVLKCDMKIGNNLFSKMFKNKDKSFKDIIKRFPKAYNEYVSNGGSF